MSRDEMRSIKDQLGLEVGVTDADGMMHVIGLFLKGMCQTRIDDGDADKAVTLHHLDAGILTLMEMVTAWMNGPMHKCGKFQDEGADGH